MTNEPEPGGASLKLTTAAGTLTLTGFVPTLWQTANYAGRWYDDAIGESKNGGADFRRREILFAVAAAESYLFEWVRDVVLKFDYRAIALYFPPESATPIRDKWKHIAQTLASDGLIDAAPNFGGTTWADFVRLVDFRNGLLHGSASRPYSTSISIGLPVPTMWDLDGMPPGRSVRIVFSLIDELNAAAGTSNPLWLIPV